MIKFTLINFPRAAILDFMTSYGCRHCQCVKQLSNRITLRNPTWRRPGNLKAKTGDNQFLFNQFEIRLYFQQFCCIDMDAAVLTIIHTGGQYASLLVMVSSISEPDVEGRYASTRTSYTAGNADNTLNRLFRDCDKK